MAATGTGTKEWAVKNINIRKADSGCGHGCKYCYAAKIAARFNQVPRDKWGDGAVVDQAKVDRPYKRKFDGWVMYPSSHDITPEILNEYLCVLRKLLDAGNRVLIVSKPHWECITVICEAYEQYKSQIMFRFTIGSTNDDVLSFWEPGAPRFAERLACLQYAYNKGYATSVSCEPYLDVYVSHTYAACSSFITDSFWIGRLRRWQKRVWLDSAAPEQIAEYVEPLKRAQSDTVVRMIYQLLKDQPFVRWKDSIRDIVNAE